MKALEFMVIVILCYSEFKLTDFLLLVLLLLSFVMHQQMVLRSEYVSIVPYSANQHPQCLAKRTLESLGLLRDDAVHRLSSHPG
jgi:hypothetical protein